MSDTLAQLLPFAIAGAIVPTWTTHVMLLLATKRPVTNSLAFVFGNFVWRIILGVIVLFFVSAREVQQFVDNIKGLPPWVTLISGLGLVGGGVYLIATRPRAKDEALGTPKWISAAESVPPALAFSWGLFDCAAPGVQYVYFLSGMTVIASTVPRQDEQLLWLLGFSAFLQLMLLAPIVIYAVFRSHADRILDGFRGWLVRWGNVMIGGILLMFGALMIVRGVQGL